VKQQIKETRDKQHDGRSRYGGLNRLREREEGGTTVACSCDLDERLVANGERLTIWSRLQKTSRNLVQAERLKPPLLKRSRQPGL
jgi:hypothetical protein